MTNPPKPCPSCKRDTFAITVGEDKLHLVCSNCRHYLQVLKGDELLVIDSAVIEFGKYKGKTLYEIRRFDPGYLSFIRGNIKGVVKEILDYRVNLLFNREKVSE